MERWVEGERGDGHGGWIIWRVRGKCEIAVPRLRESVKVDAEVNSAIQYVESFQSDVATNLTRRRLSVPLGL